MLEFLIIRTYERADVSLSSIRFLGMTLMMQSEIMVNHCSEGMQNTGTKIFIVLGWT
jgi:hypothetical protein